MLEITEDFRIGSHSNKGAAFLPFVFLTLGKGVFYPMSRHKPKKGEGRDILVLVFFSLQVFLPPLFPTLAFCESIQGSAPFPLGAFYTPVVLLRITTLLALLLQWFLT